jgi:hypothetical protein
VDLRIALVGLVTIAGGAWGIFKVLGDVRAIRRASHGLTPSIILALRVFQFSARLNLMEYRGIRYTIRAGIERGQWSVVIYPQGVETTGVKFFWNARPRQTSSASHDKKMSATEG